MRIFGREPAVVLGFISSVLSLFVAFGLGLTHEQSVTIIAVLSGLGGLAAAFMTVPRTPGVVMAAVSSLAAALAGFGLELGDQQVAALNFVILNAFALFGVRPQVTPDPEPTT